MQNSKFFTTFMVWLLMGPSVQAASFDCAKASAPIEHLICDYPKLDA